METGLCEQKTNKSEGWFEEKNSKTTHCPLFFENDMAYRINKDGCEGDGGFALERVVDL